MATGRVDVRAEPGWRRPRLTPSLAEVYRTVPVGQPVWWRKALAFAGPGYLVAVGYMDPGNWATDLAGGSAFGYSLLSVILISNLLAILWQGLAAKLGLAHRRDLAPGAGRRRRGVRPRAVDPAGPGQAVHRDRDPRRHGDAAQPVPALLHCADPALRRDTRGKAGGGEVRLSRFHDRPHVRAVHQRSDPHRGGGDVPSRRAPRGGGNPGGLPAADAALGRRRGERRVCVCAARLGPELDLDRDARGPDRDGGLPQHPAAPMATATDHAGHRDRAGRLHGDLLRRGGHGAAPHPEPGHPQPAALVRGVPAGAVHVGARQDGRVREPSLAQSARLWRRRADRPV